MFAEGTNEPEHLIPGKLYVLQNVEKLFGDEAVPFYGATAHPNRASGQRHLYKNGQVVLCIENHSTAKYHKFLIDGKVMVPCSGLVITNRASEYFKLAPT